MEEIRRLWKRCNHFVGTSPLIHDRYAALNATPEGLGIAAHNYAAMQGMDDSRLEQMCWLDASAASFNRYIDTHRIADDPNALCCLRWWRRQLFFDPQGLS